MQKKRIKLIRVFQLITIISLITLAIVIMILHISIHSTVFKARAETMRNRYITQQKKLIKREVERVVNQISTEYSRSEQETRNIVKNRVYEAFVIAENIYQQNKSVRTDKEIKQLIVDALRAIRFKKGTGYYFIVDLKGISHLHTAHPAFEETSVLDLQDTQQQFIIRDMTDIVKQSGEGFYEYYWTKPAESGADHKKISYVKMFKPLHWYIGTGLYVEDIEAQIRFNLLSVISNIHFGEDGYIFVNKLNGDALVTAGKVIAGKQKLWDVFGTDPERIKAVFKLEYTAALKPSGDYIHYPIAESAKPDKEFSKIAFIYGVPALQWLVGAGTSLNVVESHISALQARLKKQQRSEIKTIILATVALIFFSLLLFKVLSRYLTKEFDLFADFFNRLDQSNKEIDCSKISFEEFYQIANHANSMLHDKLSALKKLKLSEEKYRIFFENSANAMLMIQDKKFVDCNVSALKLLGYDNNKENFLNIYPEDLSPERQPNGEKSSLEANRMLQIAMEKGAHRFEWDHKRKNGEIVPVEVSLTAVPVDNKILLHAIWWDISQQKQAEALLQRSEERFRNLAELLPEAIFETNMEMILTYCNKQAFELYGYTEEDFKTGLHSINMFAAEERENVLNNIKAQFGGVKHNSTEYRSVKKDGTVFPALFHVSPIIKNGKPTGLRGLVIDLSDRKEAEEEILKLRKLKSVGVLAGGIAHDFNNLLAGLFGNIEMAKRYLSEEDKSYKYLDSAGMSMERATSLTQQLLTFAKGGDPVKETLSLGAVITETATFSLRGSNVKLQTEIEQNLWLVEADKGQMSQVISNLAINAKQAMPDGGVVTISAKNIATPGGNKTVQITIQDQGIGIAPQHLDKVFDPYFSTKQQGSGLGLASCYSIINKHNGTIVVESELNQGTRFILNLPAVVEQKEPSIATTEAASATDAVTESARILVLDDEELVQQMIGAMLGEMGHQIDCAVTGNEAVTKYQTAWENRQGYDLVICDLTIPGEMGGQDAAQRILSIDPQAKLIVSSGYATDPVMANYTAYGFQGRVAKPYRFAELQKVIQRVLGR